MHIVELLYPGTWIDDPDQQWSWQIAHQIHGLETPLAEAALALTWFEEESRVRRYPPLWVRAAEWQNVQETRAKVISELKLDPVTRDDYEKIDFHTEIALKRQLWEDGFLPDNYGDRIIFIHAKNFLYSLDRLERLLRVLKDDGRVPSSVKDAYDTFNHSVPNLRGVRNSLAHYDERNRGLNHGKPIDLRHPNHPRVQGPPTGEYLLMECILDKHFGCTMSDGRYGEVDVSPASLKAAGTTIQSIIDSFKWKGPPSYWPH